MDPHPRRNHEAQHVRNHNSTSSQEPRRPYAAHVRSDNSTIPHHHKNTYPNKRKLIWARVNSPTMVKQSPTKVRLGNCITLK